MERLNELMDGIALRDDGPFGGGYLLIAIPLKPDDDTSLEKRCIRTLEVCVDNSGMMGQKRWMMHASSVARVHAGGIDWVKRRDPPLRTPEQVNADGVGTPYPHPCD